MSTFTFIDSDARRGHWGEVWKATDTSLQRTVAIKFAQNKSTWDTSQLRAEATALAKVNHPNVAQVYSLAEVKHPKDGENRPCIVLEYIEGQPFTTWIASKTLPMHEAVQMAELIVDAVQSFHAKGIAHGDLHEGNIIITDGGFKVIDPFIKGDQHRVGSIVVQQKSDVTRCGYLVQQILSKSKGDISGMLASDTRLRSCGSLDEIRSEIAKHAVTQRSSLGFDDIQTTAAHRFASNTELFNLSCNEAEKCIQLEMAAFRERGAPRDLAPSFVKNIAPALNLLFAAAQSDQIDSNRATSIIRRITRIPLGSTADQTAEFFPHFVVWMLLKTSGAVSIYHRNSKFAESLCDMHIRPVNGDAKIPVLMDRHARGFPSFISGDASVCVEFLYSLYDEIEPLQEAISDFDDYAKALNAFDQFSCCYAYYRFITKKWQTSRLAPGLPMPAFLFTPPKVKFEVFFNQVSYVIEECVGLEAAFGVTYGTGPASVDEVWTGYKESLLRDNLPYHLRDRLEMMPNYCPFE